MMPTLGMLKVSGAKTSSGYYAFCRDAVFVLEEQQPATEFIEQTHARWLTLREQWVASTPEKMKPWNWFRTYLPSPPAGLTAIGL